MCRSYWLLVMSPSILRRARAGRFIPHGTPTRHALRVRVTGILDGWGPLFQSSLTPRFNRGSVTVSVCLPFALGRPLRQIWHGWLTSPLRSIGRSRQIDWRTPPAGDLTRITTMPGSPRRSRCQDLTRRCFLVLRNWWASARTRLPVSWRSGTGRSMTSVGCMM